MHPTIICITSSCVAAVASSIVAVVASSIIDVVTSSSIAGVSITSSSSIIMSISITSSSSIIMSIILLLLLEIRYVFLQVGYVDECLLEASGQGDIAGDQSGISGGEVGH